METIVYCCHMQVWHCDIVGAQLAQDLCHLDHMASANLKCQHVMVILGRYVGSTLVATSEHEFQAAIALCQAAVSYLGHC